MADVTVWQTGWLTNWLDWTGLNWVALGLGAWMTDWLTDWLTGCWLDGWMADWLVAVWMAEQMAGLPPSCLDGWLTGSRVNGWLSGSPTGWLAGWMQTERLNGWLTDWPVDCLDAGERTGIIAGILPTLLPGPGFPFEAAQLSPCDGFIEAPASLLCNTRPLPKARLDTACKRKYGFLSSFFAHVFSHSHVDMKDPHVEARAYSLLYATCDARLP